MLAQDISRIFTVKAWLRSIHILINELGIHTKHLQQKIEHKVGLNSAVVKRGEDSRQLAKDVNPRVVFVAFFGVGEDRPNEVGWQPIDCTGYI